MGRLRHLSHQRQQALSQRKLQSLLQSQSKHHAGTKLLISGNMRSLDGSPKVGSYTENKHVINLHRFAGMQLQWASLLHVC